MKYLIGAIAVICLTIIGLAVLCLAQEISIEPLLQKEKKEVFCNELNDISQCDKQRVAIKGRFNPGPRSFELLYPRMDMMFELDKWHHYDFKTEEGYVVLITEKSKISCSEGIGAEGKLYVFKQNCLAGVKCVPVAYRLVVDDWECLP
ncbi:hypothetical protein ACFL1E_03590 [Candidatus Omnitrophota bacterium]